VGDAVSIVWNWTPVDDGAETPGPLVIKQLNGNGKQDAPGEPDPIPASPGVGRGGDGLRSNLGRRAGDQLD
jgi:hypothetical protein